jgi:hypothetical protein
MTKKVTTVEGYINRLPVFGTLLLCGGWVFAFAMLNTKHPEDWSPYYFYFKAFGAVLGYLYVARWNPGGRVTINFDKSTYSEDEKTLDSLVGKYRSNTLIVLPLIGYLTADFIKGRMQGQTHIGSIEGYLVAVMIGAFITLSTCSGVKYLSAWWNIKRNWKKAS